MPDEVTNVTLTANSFFKILGPNREALYGIGVWPDIGEWFEIEGRLEACVNGLHFTNGTHLTYWLFDYPDITLYGIEPEQKHYWQDNKYYTRKARLTEQLVYKGHETFFTELLLKITPYWEWQARRMLLSGTWWWTNTQNPLNMLLAQVLTEKNKPDDQDWFTVHRAVSDYITNETDKDYLALTLAVLNSWQQ